MSMLLQDARAPKVSTFHVWGQPIFVLKPEFHGMVKPPKWDKRATKGLYLGRSPKHSGTVALVLNLSTGHITPQYHVVFDDGFETVRGDPPPTDLPLWARLAGLKPADDLHGRFLPQEFHPAMTYEGVTIESPQEPELIAMMSAIGDVEGAKMLCAFAASSSPDILYVDEALRAEDKEQFLQAMVKEIQGHEKRGHWKMVRSTDLAPDTRVFPAVWAMRRKRRIDTGEIYKHKARINLHGGRQIYGQDFDETFAPVVMWTTVRLALILVVTQGWYSLQMDFVQAYPQADIERPTYMSIPKGFHTEVPGKWVIQLVKNLYGQRQAGRVWNTHMHNGLLQLGYQPSAQDPCLYYHKLGILLVYVDDTIIISPTEVGLEEMFKSISMVFEVTSEGNLADFLGVKVTREKGHFNLAQPQLIGSILSDLNLDKDNSKGADTPALSTSILHLATEEEDFPGPWHYRSVIAKKQPLHHW